jgi:signal peptidase II
MKYLEGDKMSWLFIIIIVLLDQATKLMTVACLDIGEKIVLIDSYLQINHVRNYGAAWSILENKQVFLIGITGLIISALVYYKKTESFTRAMHFATDLIVAGAVGNLIDRIRLGNVIDMIDVKFGNLYDYPVFNVADIAVVLGTLLMAYLVLKNKAIEEDVKNDA